MPAVTPHEIAQKQELKDDSPPMAVRGYQRLVEKLIFIYLSHTRPNINFPGMITQFYK